LPLAAVAGALRNLRVHTADQAIILFEATNYNVVVNVLEAVATVTGCVVGLALHGLPGAAAGCLAGTVVGVIYGFAVPMRRFGLYLPWRHFARIAIATCVMAIVLLAIPFDRMGLALAPRIIVEMALGALVYFAALCALYPAVVRDGARRAARAFSPAS
jgi:hypothetical protein